METKQEIRKRMKEKRDAIPEEIRRKRDLVILDRLMSTEWFSDTTNFLMHAAIQSESASVYGFGYMAWNERKHLFYPKVNGDKMDFYHIDAPNELKEGVFSIREPDIERWNLLQYEKSCYADEKAVMLVPGIAFSRDGYRIGYGRGYYDRYLAARQNLYTVGVAYQEQLLDKIPAEAHDFRLDEIITDEERIIIK